MAAQRPDWRAIALELGGALERLIDEQNGPPLLLPRHREAWERAMNDGIEALERMRKAQKLEMGPDACPYSSMQ